MKKRTEILLAALCIAVLVAIDQLTKLWAKGTLMGKDDIILIKDVLQLTYLENNGAAFSMLSGMQIVFLIITPIIMIALIFMFIRLPDTQRMVSMKISLVFLFAGAVGNYIDRLATGRVVDFIFFSLINFPVFNVADIYVTCSIAALVLLVLVFYKEEELEEIWKKKE